MGAGGRLDAECARSVETGGRVLHQDRGDSDREERHHQGWDCDLELVGAGATVMRVPPR